MTLTQTAVITKRGVIILIASLVLFVIGRVGYEVYYRYTLSQQPLPTSIPKQEFGILPDLMFPTNKTSSENFTYSIDTTTGELPVVPPLVNVYFTPQTAISLLAPERARALAEKLNFPNGPETPSSDIYKFTDNQGGELIIDTPTGNFHFNSSPAESTASGSYKLPEKEIIIAEFRKFLNSNLQLSEDLNSGPGQASGSQSTIGNVSIWPADFDGLPIITADYSKGLIEADIIPGDEEGKVKFIRVNFTYWPIDKTTSSTYPLKTTEQALEDLKSGKGYVSLAPKNPHVSITSAKLAYFESPTYTPYLQPVFVFEGPGFVGLVPAISQ